MCKHETCNEVNSKLSTSYTSRFGHFGHLKTIKFNQTKWLYEKHNTL